MVLVECSHLIVFSLHACVSMFDKELPVCFYVCTHVFLTVCQQHDSTNTTANTHTHTPPRVSVCMHYVLASVSLCWSRQSWACPTDNDEEEETEELSQQRQQQRGSHRRQEAQSRHQLQPLQSGTCKHRLHSVCFLLYCLADLLLYVYRETKKQQQLLLL